VLAREAAFQLGLERVLLVPVGQAPHRRIEPEPGPEVRLELVRAAVADDPLLEACEIEVRREGPSYTYRTLELLREQRPGSELTFLMGADAAASFGSWRRPERVLELARIGVAARPGTRLEAVEAEFERLRGRDRLDVVRMPELGISSTALRERVREGWMPRYLVPDRVLEIIERRGLYA
jgi:nicotinate-nucleotide adenylyltransferase